MQNVNKGKGGIEMIFLAVLILTSALTNDGEVEFRLEKKTETCLPFSIVLNQEWECKYVAQVTKGGSKVITKPTFSTKKGATLEVYSFTDVEWKTANEESIREMFNGMKESFEKKPERYKHYTYDKREYLIISLKLDISELNPNVKYMVTAIVLDIENDVLAYFTARYTNVPDHEEVVKLEKDLRTFKLITSPISLGSVEK